MRPFGTVARLQIQRSGLKVGDRRTRVYDPAPILPVSELALRSGGVTAVGPDGGVLVDVHNAAHPETKNIGDNDLSLGFTSHYASMRQRFGPHLSDGIAGENILIAVDHPVADEELAAGIVIESAGVLVGLSVERVAPPCVEFTRFALRRPADMRADRTMTEALQFLNEGMRGFYATYAGEPFTVRVGDPVYLP